MIRWPFERTIGARILMHSGQVVRFTCDKINLTVDENAKVTGYSWQGAVGAPLFIDHTRIEAVQLVNAWRRRAKAAPDAESEARA